TCSGNRPTTLGRGLPGLSPLYTQEHNERVRVVATRIEQDGTMLRRMVDTARCRGGRQWEDLAVRALATPPPYRPVPGTPVYHLSGGGAGGGVAAGPDLGAPPLDLTTAVLAMGDAMLTASGRRPSGPVQGWGAASGSP